MRNIKKLQDMSRNRSLFICEVGNIVRLLLLSQAINAESDGIFSDLKRLKNTSSKYWKQPSAQSTVGACSQ